MRHLRRVVLLCLVTALAGSSLASASGFGLFQHGGRAMGQAGVTRALEVLQNEANLTMAFCGHTDIHRVDRRILLPGTY